MAQNGTLTEKFAERIRKEVRSGRWNGKPLLSERALSERYGISRVTVRRGLKRLCAEQLVESRPGRGYFVVPGSAGPRRPKGTRAVLFVHADPAGGATLDAMHAGIVNGAIAEAQRLGLEFYVTSQNPAGFRQTLAERWERDLRGVLLDWTGPELARFMLEADIPFVMVENDLEGLAVPAVIQDNAGGVRQALDHLAGHGHRRLALILTDDESVHPRQRLSGYREWLLPAGLAFNPGWVATGRIDAAGGREAAAAVLDCTEPPTAILVANREMLGGVIEELAARGLGWPADISLVVWGAPGADEPAGEHADVTYVTWSRQEMGRLAVLALEERVRSGRAERIVVRVPTRLVERGSVAAPRVQTEEEERK